MKQTVADMRIDANLRTDADMRDERFGINMKQWCREHEAEVRAAVSEGRATPEVLSLHRERIAWLQHERLVHLIVTVMTTACELFTVSLTVLHPELGVLPALVMLALAVLLGFYFYHYFFLENAVQRWYRLAELMEQCELTGSPGRNAEGRNDAGTDAECMNTESADAEGVT